MRNGLAMGFGQNDGTLNQAEQRVGQFAGCPGQLPGALRRDGVEGSPRSSPRPPETCPQQLAASGYSYSQLERKGTEQAAGTPKVWRAFFQMFQKGQGLFYRDRYSEVRATC